MDRMRTSGLFVAVLMWTVYAVPAFCQPAPTDGSEGIDDTTRAVAWVEEVCDGLVDDNPEPFREMLKTSDIPEALLADIRSRQALTKQEERDAVRGFIEGIGNAAVTLCRSLKDGRYVILEAREENSVLSVPVRIETEGSRVFLTFMLRRHGNGWRLNNASYPLVGMDLRTIVSMLLTKRPHAPIPVKKERATVKINRLSERLGGAGLSLLLFLGIGWLVYRIGGAKRRGTPFHKHPVLYVVLVIWAAAVATGIVRGRQKRADAAAFEAVRKIQRAGQLLARGNYAETEALARQALEHSPDNPFLLMYLGNSLIMQEKNAQAEEVFNELIALNQMLPLAHNQLAMIAEQRKEYPEAIRHMQSVMENMAEDDALLCEIANFCLLNNDVAGARKRLDRALEINAASDLALEMRARFSLREGNPDAAVADLATIKEYYGLNLEFLAQDEEFAPLMKNPKYAAVFAVSAADSAEDEQAQ